MNGARAVARRYAQIIRGNSKACGYKIPKMGASIMGFEKVYKGTENHIYKIDPDTGEEKLDYSWVGWVTSKI